MVIRQQLVPERKKLENNIAKIKKGGESFEIVLRDPDKALEFRQGRNISMSDILETPKIFSDAKKGDVQTDANCKKWLGTSDHDEVAKVILTKGELALTQEQRKKFLDAKKKKIVDYINKNASDSKTKLPIPKQRIELAMEQAKVQIDPYQTAETQMDKIIKELTGVLAMSFEQMRIKVTIPAQYASSAYASLKSKFELHDELWQDDGSVKFKMEAPAGMRSDIFDFINKLTKGEAEIEEQK